MFVHMKWTFVTTLVKTCALSFGPLLAWLFVRRCHIPFADCPFSSVEAIFRPLCLTWCVELAGLLWLCRVPGTAPNHRPPLSLQGDRHTICAIHGSSETLYCLNIFLNGSHLDILTLMSIHPKPTELVLHFGCHSINLFIFSPFLWTVSCSWSTMAFERRMVTCLSWSLFSFWYHNLNNMYLRIAAPTRPLRIVD